MSKNQNELKAKLNPFLIILLSCLLASLMILNSNHVNKQRALIKLAKEKEESFYGIAKLRKLEDNENTKEVCDRASNDLNEYYKTRDLSKIDLYNDPIKCEECDKSYMKALIDLVREYADDDDSPSNEQDEDLRNLEGDIDTDKLKEYIPRIIPFAVFAAFGILSIFGWIGCCIFCCCDCCCCCCCKKDGCTIPCFIFSYTFYALVVGVCIYGLTEANKIFVGLANAECSILKFFGEVLNGEDKTELPRWAGIKGINNLLDNLVDTITDLKDSSFDTLSNGISNIETKKSTFRTKMEEAGNSFFDPPNSNTYKSVYSKDYSGQGITNYPLEDTYVLDLVKQFGKKVGEEDGKDKYPEQTSLWFWNEEFSIVAGNADEYLATAHDGFNEILNESFDTVISGLKDGSTNLDKLTKPFTDAEKEIGDILSDYAGHIDKYGKMGVKIVFSVLMVMNIALAVLIILIYMFSGKSCVDCCFFRCIFKSCTHILWNILALMMILAFLIGSILGLIGRIGGDMMSLVTYIMSEENFNSTTPLLLDELDEANKYIQTCIHGDGDISKDLNLGDSLNAFDDINNVEGNITMVKGNFTRIKDDCFTYKEISTRLQQEKDFENSTLLIPVQGESNQRYPIDYDKFLEKINDLTKNNQISWSRDSPSTSSCQTNSNSPASYHPKYCPPKDYSNSISGDFPKYAEILADIDFMVTYANNEANTDSVKKVIDSLKGDYIIYLDGYTNVLDSFLKIIHRVTDIVREYSGDGDAFAFLNGKFIGTNLKIILKFLKYSLGVDLYNVGVCLCVVGLSLILSISSTILLMVIINIKLKKIMDASKTPITAVAPNEVQIPYVVNGTEQIMVQPKYV